MKLTFVLFAVILALSTGARAEDTGTGTGTGTGTSTSTDVSTDVQTPVILPAGDDVAALNQWAAIFYPLLYKIEFYLGTIAAIAGLGLGLMTWRLILLSKNQKTLF